MTLHDWVDILLSFSIAALWFILSSFRDRLSALEAKQAKDLEDSNKRFGALEVSQGEIKTSLKYICNTLDEIKDWMKHGQKGPL